MKTKQEKNHVSTHQDEDKNISLISLSEHEKDNALDKPVFDVGSNIKMKMTPYQSRNLAIKEITTEIASFTPEKVAATNLFVDDNNTANSHGEESFQDVEDFIVGVLNDCEMTKRLAGC